MAKQQLEYMNQYPGGQLQRGQNNQQVQAMQQQHLQKQLAPEVEEDDEEEESEEESSEEEEPIPKKTVRVLPGTKPQQQAALPKQTQQASTSRNLNVALKNQQPASAPPPKKVQQRSRVDKNLRIFYIRFVFIVIYFLGLKKLILAKKKKFQLEMNDTINKAFELGTEWALTFLESYLNRFWESKDKYDWLSEDRLSDKEKQARANRCLIFLDKLIDIMIEYTKESNFDPELLSFLANISQNFQFPPQNFFFPFEINRIEFTAFGALKNQTKTRMKLTIANFLLIRVIGFTILYSPWNLGLEQIKQSDQLQEFCFVIVISQKLHDDHFNFP